VPSREKLELAKIGLVYILSLSFIKFRASGEGRERATRNKRPQHVRNLPEIQKTICTPPLLAEKDQYLIKFATTPEEIEEALRLRYRIFNLEQGKGLETAKESGIDRDEFDEYCLHLIVVEKRTNAIVGTYRVHLGPVASRALGFYSSREYKMDGLDAIASQTIEVGRSCVSPEYRNGAVVALLWSGISEILLRSKLRYLFGCVSLESVDPAAGWALYEYFKSTGKICQPLRSTPLEKFQLPKPPQERIDAIFNDKRLLVNAIPPLFKGYLRIGTMVCGEPAFDFEFGTIDFLILLDRENIPPRYSRHFNVDTLNESSK
jgi:putative hemolysin